MKRLKRPKRLVIFVLVAAAGLALGFDLGAAPEEQWSARGLIGAIKIYQRTLSPVLGTTGVKCRFEPTCSHYGVAVVKRYGTLGGSWRAGWRLLRCAPWTPAGTVDLP